MELRKPFFRVSFQSSLSLFQYDYAVFIESWKKCRDLRIKSKVVSACVVDDDGDMFWYEEQGFNPYKKLNGEEITIQIIKMVKCRYIEHLESQACYMCENS